MKWISEDNSEVLYIGRVDSFRKVRTSPRLIYMALSVQAPILCNCSA